MTIGLPSRIIKQGTDTIPQGVIIKDTAHGLGYTPGPEQISITPHGDYKGRQIFLDTGSIDGTNFRVEVTGGPNPGAPFGDAFSYGYKVSES